MTDLRKAAKEAAKVLANALSIDFNDKRDWYSYKHDVEYAANLLRQALAQGDNQEPDCGIDRGAWSDVPNATKWVDELRGDEEFEQEPVACHIDQKTGNCECRRADFTYDCHAYYTAPPSKPEQGCCECGVTVSEGYALYCVKCVEPLFK